MSASDGTHFDGIGPFGRQVWADLDESIEHLTRVSAPNHLPDLPSPLPIGLLADDAVAVASLAANLVIAQRASPRRTTYPEADHVSAVRVDPARVRTSFSSERVLRVNGEQPQVWASHSGFFRAADGWVRVHGNYAHHAEKACALLGLKRTDTPASFKDAISRVEAQQLEDRAAVEGAIIVRVRSEAEWLSHPQGIAADRNLLVSAQRIGHADARPWPAAAGPPLAGIRVLDLCRVIAGPVGTRMLAQAGAEVLRVDTPALPEPVWQHFDTGQGKRSTMLDLRDSHDLASLDRLLASADVVVTGYRPHALDRFGLAPANLAGRFPGLVIANIAAWDPTGPWNSRRGFDSIVQAVSGIAQAHAADGAPGAMPAQALDHSSGYFLAAAILSSVARQRREGGTHHVQVTLDRVAAHLLRARGHGPTPATPDDPWPVTVGTIGDQPFQCAQPPSVFAGTTESWPRMASPHGSDSPEWTVRPTTAD